MNKSLENDIKSITAVWATPHTSVYIGAIPKLAVLYIPAIAAPIRDNKNIKLHAGYITC